ncbi:ATP-binding protein [Streptomyces sp. NPDC098085]|uniref:ATP-binding protein n=1 Tax=Streptomyces sp. NPDC098085 TaxID=3366094 RepID=UPI00380BB3E6
MGAGGTHDAGADAHESVPGPLPPVPGHAPAPPRPDGTAYLAWARAPRPEAAVGIWRQGHRTRPETEPETVPGRQLLVGALLALLAAWCAWSLLYNGYVGLWWLLPLELVTPDSWRYGQAGPVVTAIVYYGYYALIGGGLLVAAGRMGRWAEVWRRYGPARVSGLRPQAPPPPPAPEEDPARWPQLRAAGADAAADRLTSDAATGLMRDVDHARIAWAWHAARSARRSDAVAAAVRERGAAACAHPSGARDLPVRVAQHDLLTHQVLLGTAADSPKNPYAYRSADIGIGPELLGTSLLAVGPSGAGKTTRVIRPIIEGLCLQALAGRAAVVVVGAAGADLGPAGQYDIVVHVGHPDSKHDLDLYGGAADPDEAAAVLAQALVGDLAGEQGGDSRRAATLLGRLLGPFRAAHGRFPAVPELRQLLDGAPEPLAALRAALEGAQQGLLRDLDAVARQVGVPGGPGAVLADRVALLDRPAFAAFFDPMGEGRAFSLRALDHPVRVRIDLPDRGHPDAARVLVRLVLAQFTAHTAGREDRSLFAALVLDDATAAITGEAVRGMQRLRSGRAGIVLALRTLDDVPESLRAPLLGACGCRIVLAGVTPWDGGQFAQAWGTEWIETRDVTDRQIIAETTGGKAWHALRKAVTGKAVTARAVTVRQVERERWSASELAHSVPPGHAVVSLSSVQGERTSPLLVDLRTRTPHTRA